MINNLNNRGRVCLFSQNQTTILVMKNVHFDFLQVLREVIIACCEDISGHYCIQKTNNDHFHP